MQLLSEDSLFIQDEMANIELSPGKVESIAEKEKGQSSEQTLIQQLSNPKIEISDDLDEVSLRDVFVRIKEEVEKLEEEEEAMKEVHSEKTETPPQAPLPDDTFKSRIKQILGARYGILLPTVLQQIRDITPHKKAGEAGSYSTIKQVQAVKNSKEVVSYLTFRKEHNDILNRLKSKHVKLNSFKRKEELREDAKVKKKEGSPIEAKASVQTHHVINTPAILANTLSKIDVVKLKPQAVQAEMSKSTEVLSQRQSNDSLPMTQSLERIPPIGLLLDKQQSAVSRKHTQEKPKISLKQPIFKVQQKEQGRNNSNSLSRSPKNNDVSQDFKLRNADMKAINPSSMIEINEQHDFQVDELEATMAPS